MKNRRLQDGLTILVIVLIGGGIAWAGSQGSLLYPRHTPLAPPLTPPLGSEADGAALASGPGAGWPLFAICAALSFGINWLAFIPAWLFQTERYFDLMGSVTYLTLVATALVLGVGGDPRTSLIAACIAAWAIRLGSFLFLRIHEDGSDGRFDRIKPIFTRFLMTWTLQGLWVFLTISCGLAAMLSEARQPLGLWALMGFLLWVFGFAFETIADRQKRRFRANEDNAGRFIQSGLWSWSQHPNYFGEIVLWVGIALIAFPALRGWQWVTLISPVFVFVLLTRISGIPLLDARGEKRWGEEPAYRAYRTKTPILFPRPPAHHTATAP